MNQKPALIDIGANLVNKAFAGDLVAVLSRASHAGCESHSEASRPRKKSAIVRTAGV